jgi:amidohydrolase
MSLDDLTANARKYVPQLKLLLAQLERELPDAVVLRHELHATPELGYVEFETSRIVAEALPVRSSSLLQTGILARVGRGAPTAIGVRAELDGLPLAELTNSPFAATNGCMHACGHDVHLAALVALVRAAHRMADELPAPLLAIFQPSEERHPSGALALTESPELRDAVRAVVAAHLHPDLSWGTVGAEPGVVNAAADAAEIVVEGVAGHGAYPHRARDPVLALAHVVVALHSIVGRRVDPTHGAAITVGMLSAGATENVIPARAEARATLRALDIVDQGILRDAVRATVEGIAGAFGCSGTVAFTKSEPPLVNDATLAAAVRQLGPEAGSCIAPPWRSCGGDDFAHYGALAPSLMVFVGLHDAASFTPVPLHHPEFLAPDEAVGMVARAQALAYIAACTAYQVSEADDPMPGRSAVNHS